MEAANEEQRQRILPLVANGEMILTVGLLDPRMSLAPAGVTMRAARRGPAWSLTGEKPFVSDAAAATHVVVAARTGEGPDDIGLFLVDTKLDGVSMRNLAGFLSWEGVLTLDGVEIDSVDLLGGATSGGWSAVERALEKAWPILSAYQVGACQAVIDMTVAYTQERVQFSVPIGRFQRVQDHVIRMVNFVDGARWATNEALWKLDTGRPGRASAHLSQALASEAYLEVCNAGHEVHAGVGSSNDYGLVKHTRMSRTLLTFLGDPTWHKRRMADALAW
jgi:alkylation response protein AidB-like acyl-CoA dehydrogenase